MNQTLLIYQYLYQYLSIQSLNLLTQSLDQTTKLWNLKTGNLLETVASAGATSMALSHCGYFEVAGHEDATLTFKNMRTKSAVTLLKRHSNSISTIVLSKCGRYVLSGSLDNTVILQDLQDAKNYRKQNIHTNVVTSIAISPDNKYVLTSGLDQKVQLIEIFTGKLKGEVKGHDDDIMTVGFSSCGRFFVTAGKDNIGQLQDTETLTLLTTYGNKSIKQNFGIYESSIDPIGHQDWILTSKISPNNKYVVTGGKDKQSILWDLRSGNRLAKLNGHKGSVTSIDFSPDSDMVVTASADGNSHVQDIKNKEIIYKLEGHKAPIWSIAVNQWDVSDDNDCCDSRNGEQDSKSDRKRKSDIQNQSQSQSQYQSEDVMRKDSYDGNTKRVNSLDRIINDYNLNGCTPNNNKIISNVKNFIKCCQSEMKTIFEVFKNKNKMMKTKEL